MAQAEVQGEVNPFGGWRGIIFTLMLLNLYVSVVFKPKVPLWDSDASFNRFRSLRLLKFVRMTQLERESWCADYYLPAYDTDDAPTPALPPASPVPGEQSSQLAQKLKPKPQEAITQYHPLFSKGTPLDMHVFLTEKIPFTDYDSPSALVMHERNIVLGDWSPRGYRSKNMSIALSPSLRNNGSAYLFIVFTPANLPPNPASPHHKARLTWSVTHPIVRYLPKQKSVMRKNLMSGEEKEVLIPVEEPSAISAPLGGNQPIARVSYWKPNITISLVDDFNGYPASQVPTAMKDQMLFTPEGLYYPTIFMNEFWLLREHLIPINESTPNLPLWLFFEPIALFKWQIFFQMEESFKMQTHMGMGASDIDELKTNFWLLCLTGVVSMLHMIFDFLAFKNDISFWRNNKSMEGLSVRTLFTNCAMQIVIFLYLLDNDTSWMILLSQGIGLVIEIWKVTKAVIVNVQWRGIIPIFSYKDRASYASKTKEYDEYIMRKLQWVAYPLVGCYAVYSLVYNTHKSWYSWVLSSLTGAIYTFGFIMMTPQLFINYKLQSVAHLPWRTFMYKALNTFIDDLFAFIVRMPMLHRLACFRDDIIFLVYLYQRWIYPVDKKRVNEFGQGGEEHAAPNTAAPAATPKGAAPKAAPAKPAAAAAKGETKKEK